jgi:hypothetical protein
MHLKCKGSMGTYWIHVAQDKGLWGALLVAVMNLGFNKTTGFSWVAEQVFAS